MSIGAKLKEARVKANLNLDQVSSITRIRRDVLINLEAGVTPVQVGTLDALCFLYNINPHDLLRTADTISFKEAVQALHLGNDEPFRRLLMRN